MHKKNYNKAEIEIMYFDKKDVITASGKTDPTGTGDDSGFTPDKYSVLNSPLSY